MRQNSRVTDHCLKYFPEATWQIQTDYPHLKHLLIFGDEEIKSGQGRWPVANERRGVSFSQGEVYLFVLHAKQNETNTEVEVQC